MKIKLFLHKIFISKKFVIFLIWRDHKTIQSRGHTRDLHLDRHHFLMEPSGRSPIFYIIIQNPHIYLQARSPTRLTWPPPSKQSRLLANHEIRLLADQRLSWSGGGGALRYLRSINESPGRATVVVRRWPTGRIRANPWGVNVRASTSRQKGYIAAKGLQVTRPVTKKLHCSLGACR